jgi:hypothetical protein
VGRPGLTGLSPALRDVLRLPQLYLAGAPTAPGKTLTGVESIDWAEIVGLHEQIGRAPVLIASGSLRDMSRQALKHSSDRRRGLTLVSPRLGTLDDMAIIALVLRPGFVC